jgi:hypothetical protein
MGRFTYSRGLTADFDDRVLAHLQVVITALVARGEGFHFSWEDGPGPGEGMTVVWMHSAVPMAYTFSDGDHHALNPAWLEALRLTAESPSGLHVVPEPGGSGQAATRPPG